MRDDGRGNGVPAQRQRVLERAALVFVLVAGFELMLLLAARILFPHGDTPGCAGTDPFCSTGQHVGLAGGALVVLVGHAAAALLVTVLLARRASRRRVRGRR